MQRKTPPPPNIKKKPPMNIPKPPTMLPTVVREQNQHQEGRQENQINQVPKVEEIKSQLTVGQQISTMQPQQIQQNLVREQQNQFNNQSSITNQNEQKPSISNPLQQQQLPSNTIQHQQNSQNQLTTTTKPPAPPVQKNKIPPPSGMNKKTPTNPIKRVGPPKLPTPIVNSQINNLQQEQKQIGQEDNNRENANLQIDGAGSLQPTTLISNENKEVKLPNSQIEQKNQTKIQVKNQVPKAKVPQKPKNQSIPIPIKKNLPPFQKTSLPSPQKIQQPKIDEPIQQQQNISNPIPTIQPPPIQQSKTFPTPQQFPPNTQPNSQATSSQYSELQQKLKKLQLLRSQINQSSQEQQYSDRQQQYDEKEDENNQIEQQQENQRESLEGDMQRQNFQENINNENVNIVQYQNQNEQQRRQQPEQRQEFRIQETNYQDMEVKDYVEENNYKQENQNTNLQAQIFNNKLEPSEINNQQTSQTQPNTNPTVYLQTVYQSNIATQQTQHRYLPDQVSNSLQKSQNRAIYDDLQRGQNLNQLKRNNNVDHVNKYHSLANFATQQKVAEIEEEQRKAIQQFRVKQEKSDVQFIRHHLQQQNHVNDTNKKHQQVSQNYSLQMIHQNDTKSLNSQSFYQANKQNILTLPSILKSSSQNPQKTIQQLLQEFKSKKSQYLTNMQNLKKIQQKQKIQEMKYQQKLRKLVDQINHKNLLILRNAHLANQSNNFITNSIKYDKNEKIVNQKNFVQVQQL